MVRGSWCRPQPEQGREWGNPTRRGGCMMLWNAGSATARLANNRPHLTSETLRAVVCGSCRGPQPERKREWGVHCHQEA
eukprot:14582224-Alexandrium_andersonii.AAC.1